MWRNCFPRALNSAAAALLLAALSGCATKTFVYDAENPLIFVDQHGFRFDKEYVQPDKIPNLLHDYGITTEQTIYISVDEDARKDLRPSRLLMAYLAKCGYTQPMLITTKHSASEKVGKREGVTGRSGRFDSATKPKIRYRSSNE